MTLFQTVKILENISASQPNVRTVGNGSVYTILDTNPSIKYSAIVISQTSHREDDENDYYGFNVFYVDRLDDTLEDNRLQIQSIAKETLSNILKYCRSEFDWEYTTIVYHPFTQKFVDETAGMYVTVEIEISKDNICEEDYV